MENTINAMKGEANFVIIGTPIDLTRLVNLEIPSVRARYELDDSEGKLREAIMSLDFINA